MRWAGQEIAAETPGTLPGLGRVAGLIRTVETPEFDGIAFHEVRAKSALNRISDGSRMPFRWSVNPYRGCSHACAYCFARPTHGYLGLDGPRDFETQIVVKVNAPELLRAELSRPSWRRETVAIGTNTDAYQRAEGRYRLMPGIIAALADSGTPFGILSKGTLVRRDLPLLAAVARDVRVRLSVSLAFVDGDLGRTLEPGAPSTEARLDTIRAIRAAGLGVGVFMAPVVPYLTDTEEHLAASLARLDAAGAHLAGYEVLHLRPGTKEPFARWLAAARPDLVPRYRALYGSGAYAHQDYTRGVSERIRRLRADYAWGRGADDEAAEGEVESRECETVGFDAVSACAPLF